MNKKVEQKAKGRSLLKAIRGNKIAYIFCVVLTVFYLTSIYADFLAPYTAHSEVRHHSYAPPTKIHFIDEKGDFHFVPFIYAQKASFDEYKRRIFVENKDVKGFFSLYYEGETRYLFGFIPSKYHLFGFDLDPQEGRYYLLGADARGRDVFSRILYGSRISLSIGIFGSIITLFLGIFFGSVAGYFRGKTDMIIMRICEFFMLIPALYLLFALRAVFPLTLSGTQIYIIIILILSFISWASLARVIRGLVLSLREKEYVLAAKALGQSHAKIIMYHIIPNTFSYLIVVLTLSIPTYILSESTLSFLGLGIQDPNVSWGYMLADAAKVSELSFHPWILWPGVFIILTVLSYNIFGNFLRDYFDPKTIQ